MDMKEHDDRVTQAVSDQAAEWFIRLRDRDLTAADRRKYVRWLKYSPSHIAEFMRLCQLYGRVKRAKVPTLLPEEEASNIIALGAAEQLSLQEPPRRRVFESHRFRFAAAACCVALMGVIANIAFSSNTIETRLGEWRQVQLADGSVVSVGANTLLQVDFERSVRRVHLQRGEAMFQVTKDPARPFIVNADSAAVRAVGTRFGVDRREDSVRVTVAEGRVAVLSGVQAAAALERLVDMNVALALVKDERVDVPVNAPTTVPLRREKVNSMQALAWAKGQLIFQNETLGEAVREFNRRNRVQIRVDDPAIAAWHVCCVFDAADPEAFAKVIALDDAITVVHDGPNTLRLVPQAPGQAEAPERDDAI